MPLLTGQANAAAPANVAENDLTTASLTLGGALRVAQEGTGTAAMQVQGNVAHDSADAGNPVGIGGNAVSAPSATVTAGDRVRATYSLDGQAFVIAVGRAAIDAAITGNPINMGVRCSTDAATQVTADGRVAMPSADRLGRVRITDPAGEAYAGADGAWTITSGVPAAASVVLKASAGRLCMVQALNSNAAVRFLQIHNLAAVLSGAEVPVISVPMPLTNGTPMALIDFRAIGGARFGTGIVVAFSTTRDTYTAATAGDNFYTALTK